MILNRLLVLVPTDRRLRLTSDPELFSLRHVQVAEVNRRHEIVDGLVGVSAGGCIV